MSVRKLSGAAVVGLVAMLAGNGTASAQGFFDQLFGGSPNPAPTYNDNSATPYDPTQGLFPGDNSAPIRRHVHKRPIVVDAKPVRQTPTDLMHDKTLHVGDAVMMKDGIHIYTGPQGATHTKHQFVALDTTREIGKTEKQRLAALDPVHVDPIQESRSATEVSNGFKITDARGNSVRYVGP